MLHLSGKREEEGLRDNIDDIEDCLSQLPEVVTKCRDSHSIILGGGFNEDLSNNSNSRRKRSLQQFLSDKKLSTLPTEKDIYRSKRSRSWYTCNDPKFSDR